MNALYELYKTYNYFEESGMVDLSENIENETVLLPIFHWNNRSNGRDIIEITLSDDSEFMGARFIPKDEYIIFPVTEDSLTRTSGFTAHPISDNLSYLSRIHGDDDNEKKLLLYKNQLKEWADYNAQKCGSIIPGIILKYIESETMLDDITSDIGLSYEFVQSGGSNSDEKSKKSNKKSSINFNYEDNSESKSKVVEIKNFEKTFVTFLIEGDERTSITRSKALHDDYINYYQSILDIKPKDKCVFTAENTYCGSKYKGFQGSGSKLVSVSNNKEVYFGRFIDSSKTEKSGIFNVGYIAMTKALNMLKFYTDKKSTHIAIGADSYLINWISGDDTNSDDLEKSSKDLLIPSATNESILKLISGIKKTHISREYLILIIDKVSSGRASIKYFRKFLLSDLLQKVEKWYLETAWEKYNYKSSVYEDRFNPLFTYPDYIYGIEAENNGKLECKSEKLSKKTKERLIPCLVEGKKIPFDIVNTVMKNSAKRQRYSYLSWQNIVHFSCSIFKKYMIDYSKGDVDEMLDLKSQNRSYLYGRILAIYEKIERDTYSDDEKKKRQTNVMKYWEKFVNHPAETLALLRTKLKPYILKNEYFSFYERELDEIMDLLDQNDKDINKKLGYMYIFGYDQEMKSLYQPKK